MAHDVHRIGDVKQEQPSNDKVEWLGVAPAGDVTLRERKTTIATSPVPRFRERVRRLIESDDGSRRPDHFCDQLRNVPQACTEIERAHARADPGRPEQQTRGGLDHSGLCIESRDFRRAVAKDVLSSR
jgi:hypothetical protein